MLGHGTNGWSEPQATGPLPEGPLPALENLAHLRANGLILKSASLVRKLGQLTGAMRTAVGDDDLVGVGVHNEVRIVRDDDDLTAALRTPEERDELVED